MQASISKNITTLLFILTVSLPAFAQRQIAITMDDPNTRESVLMDWQQRNTAILHTLAKHKIQAALFVCGMRVNHYEGKQLLELWDWAGHLICNHSYSHLYFNGKGMTAATFMNDFKRGDSVINAYKNYTRLFRFPYLKEGNTREKTDSMRTLMQTTGYANGHVSVDASDWYVDAEMTKAIQADPKTDLTPYRDYYVQHILNRANYYDSLAQQVWQKPVKHTLLVHHSLLNALFLDDVIRALKKHGWILIDAREAFADPIYRQQPQITPTGESIIWQLAKQNPKYASGLRYPAEDGKYEEEGLKQKIRDSN